VAQGGVVFAAAVILTQARWGRVLERIAAGMGVLLPFSFLVLGLLWFGRRHLFPWLDEANRPAWLDARWLFARDALVLAGMTALSLAFLYASLRPDLHAAQETISTNGWLARWITRGWRGRQEEREQSRRWRGFLATALAIGFFPSGALLSIDLAMSLDPHFHSTIFPLIFLAGSFYSALALTAILAALWRRDDDPEPVIGPSVLLNLGNLLWSFGMLLAYFWWSEYLSVWMANLPDEVAHHVARWQAPPWHLVARADLITAFVIPFFLLFSRGLKQSPRGLAAVGGIGAAGVLLQRFLDALPFLRPGGGAVPFLVSLAISIGFLGAAALPYFWFMRRVPLFPVEDPQFLEQLQLRGITV
jgi:hypothetical protein